MVSFGTLVAVIMSENNK
ncbi:hypothetical protein [Aciduricibacillus chroicocephali]